MARPPLPLAGRDRLECPVDAHRNSPSCLPPVGKRGILHPGCRPGLLLADGPPAIDGARRLQILLVWADHSEAGEPIAWPPKSRRRGALPLRDALVEAGTVHLKSAHARLVWRAAVDGPWPAWPDPNPFDEKRR